MEKQAKTIPYILYELSEYRHEKREKRLAIHIAVLTALLVAATIARFAKTGKPSPCKC